MVTNGKHLNAWALARCHHALHLDSFVWKAVSIDGAQAEWLNKQFKVMNWNVVTSWVGQVFHHVSINDESTRCLQTCMPLNPSPASALTTPAW